MTNVVNKIIGLCAVPFSFVIFSNAAADSDIVGSASTVASQKYVLERAKEHDRYLLAKYQNYADNLHFKKINAAAINGNLDAQFELGHIYRSGQGVNKSDIIALMWYTISAENGVKNAEREKKFTEQYMAVDQIALARKMAKKWIKKADFNEPSPRQQ